MLAHKCGIILSVILCIFLTILIILWSIFVLVTWHSIEFSWFKFLAFLTISGISEFLDISLRRSWQNFSKTEQEKLIGKLDSAIFNFRLLLDIKTLKLKKKSDYYRAMFSRFSLWFCVSYAGRRTDFRDNNRELFSGELFSGELFSGAALLPENFVPINVCGVDSFSPN